MADFDYKQEYYNIHHILMDLVDKDSIDELSEYAFKFITLQNYMITNKDKLCSDAEFDKIYDNVANHISYIAQRIEDATAKKYKKGSEDYKHFMRIAYKTHQSIDMSLLSEHTKDLLVYMANDCKYKAYYLKETPTILEVEYPQTAEIFKPFKVTYICNPYGSTNFKIIDNTNFKILSGPSVTRIVNTDFILKYTITILSSHIGQLTLPKAQIKVDNEILTFPDRVVEVKTLPSVSSIANQSTNNKPYIITSQSATNNLNAPKSQPISNSNTTTPIDVVFQEISHPRSWKEKYKSYPWYLKALIKLPIPILISVLGAFLFIRSDSSIHGFAYFVWMTSVVYAIIAVFTNLEQLLYSLGGGFGIIAIAVGLSVNILPEVRIVKDAQTYKQKYYFTTSINASGHHYKLSLGEDYIINLTGRTLYISDVGYGSKKYAPRNVVTIRNGEMVTDPGIYGFFKEPPMYIRTKGSGMIESFLDFKSY